MQSGTKPQVLNVLTNWYASVGITLNCELLRLQPMQPAAEDCTAYAVAARQALSEGDQLGVIPKSACLSIRTTSISDLIQRERLGGGLGLILAVMHERSRGAMSKWCAPLHEEYNCYRCPSSTACNG